MKIPTMLRFTGGLAAIVMLLVTPAQAEIDIQRYVDLSRVNCDDSQTIADMEEIWVSMRTSSGATMSNDRATVLTSKLRNKSANKLSCSVTVRTSRGIDRGLFVLTVFPDNDWEVKFIPNY